MCCLYFQVNDVKRVVLISSTLAVNSFFLKQNTASHVPKWTGVQMCALPISSRRRHTRSEKHTSELQSLTHLVCRLLLEKKRKPSTRQARRSSRTTRATSPARTRYDTDLRDKEPTPFSSFTVLIYNLHGILAH